MPDGLAGVLTAWVLAITSLAWPATPTVDPSRPPSFPVAGPVRYSAFHHDYPAADVFARCGARVVAPVDGTVLEVARTDRWDPTTDRGADRGGLAFSIEGDDGVRYYGSHLRSLEPGLRAGAGCAPVTRSGGSATPETPAASTATCTSASRRSAAAPATGGCDAVPSRRTRSCGAGSTAAPAHRPPRRASGSAVTGAADRSGAHRPATDWSGGYDGGWNAHRRTLVVRPVGAVHPRAR